MAFGGRYIILLMAAFSVYTGFIYNEFFSFPMAIFGTTRYKCIVHDAVTDIDVRACGEAGGEVKLPPGQTPYVMGLDPVWHGTKSELPYLNSMKMKMSILLGVAHMNMGIINSLFNHRYFHDKLSLVCEFIPQARRRLCHRAPCCAPAPSCVRTTLRACSAPCYPALNPFLPPPPHPHTRTTDDLPQLAVRLPVPADRGEVGVGCVLLAAAAACGGGRFARARVPP